MRRISYLIICLCVIICTYCYMYYRWKHLWRLDGERSSYCVKHIKDDTIRIVMVGDSWAGMHHQMIGETFLINKIKSTIALPIVFESSGQGGEKTKGIYDLMFDKSDRGTRRLLEKGPDYCIIIAGINDAAANLGVRQYCFYYQCIIKLLLDNQIRPVIVELPNVNLWHIYKDKPLKDLLSDYLKSVMTSSNMYQIKEYREALLSMLENKNILDEVLYVHNKCWNNQINDVNKTLFLEDQIHLNYLGYKQLDSCIAMSIVDDYNRR